MLSARSSLERAVLTTNAEVGRPDRPVGLSELIDVVLNASHVEEVLGVLAHRAVETIHPGSSCGITIRRSDGTLAVASSDDFAMFVDQFQHELGEGPCLSALAHGEVILVNDMTTETRWPRFLDVAARLGVQAVLCTPISLERSAAGVINLYARRTHAFIDVHRWRATTFADQTGGVVGLAVRLAEQVELAEQMEAALASRAVIDQAIGVIMAQNRCAKDEAFAVLRRASSHRNRKLRDIAQDVVTSVTGPPVAWRRHGASGQICR